MWTARLVSTVRWLFVRCHGTEIGVAIGLLGTPTLLERGIRVPWSIHISRQDLSGQWSLCLYSDANSVCDQAYVSANYGPVMQYSAWYPIMLDLNLNALFRPPHPRLDTCGSLLVHHDWGPGLDLGIPCCAVVEADGGLGTGPLEVRGDSIVGEWRDRCFDVCPTHGKLVMVRERGR